MGITTRCRIAKQLKRNKSRVGCRKETAASDLCGWGFPTGKGTARRERRSRRCSWAIAVSGSWGSGANHGVESQASCSDAFGQNFLKAEELNFFFSLPLIPPCLFKAIGSLALVALEEKTSVVAGSVWRRRPSAVVASPVQVATRGGTVQVPHRRRGGTPRAAACCGARRDGSAAHLGQGRWEGR